MSDLSDLYQDLILDHYTHPRHRGGLADANRMAEGHNPLCGDEVRVRLRVEDGVVADIAFEGGGCAVSTASASLMADAVKGRTVPEALALFERVTDVLTGRTDLAETDDLGKVAALTGVREYPMRVKCATLAWHTLHEALADTGATASSETT